jgi:hypothetical protein
VLPAGCSTLRFAPGELRVGGKESFSWSSGKTR